MLYFKYISMVARSRMQYTLSIWMQIGGQFLMFFTELIALYMLFDRFGALGDWTLGEVALCFGIVQTSFAFAEMVAVGFDTFGKLIVSGDFDRLLLRPRSLILQVFGSDFAILRFGKLVQGLISLVVAVIWLDMSWTAPKVCTLILMIISAAFIFTGIFVLGAALSFITIEGLEVVNLFSYGGRELASYPLTIYNKWIIRFFTFIIPFGCFNYLPLMYITDRAASLPILYMLSPLLGVLFIVPCLLVWRLGVRKYLSTGS